MSSRTLLTDPPRPLDPWLRHGFLAFCLTLGGWHLHWLARHAWTHDHDIISVVLVALVMNHLAFRFSWPRPVMIGLRVVAGAWLAFALGWWLWVLQGRISI